MHKDYNNVHLARVMRMLGPLTQFWFMPHERKNHEIMIVAQGCNCNKNEAYTLAIKNQLYMSYRKMCCDSVESYYEVGPVLNGNAELEIRHFSANNQGVLETCKSYRHLTFCGKKLVPGSIIIIKIDKKGATLVTIVTIYEAKESIYLCV